MASFAPSARAVATSTWWRFRQLLLHCSRVPFRTHLYLAHPWARTSRIHAVELETTRLVPVVRIAAPGRNRCAARGGELRAIAHGRAGAAKHTEVRVRPLPRSPSPPSSHTSSNTCARLEPSPSRHEHHRLISPPDASNRPVAKRCAVSSPTSTLHLSLKRAPCRYPQHLV